MIKRNIFKMFASAVMLLLACSCSSDQELDIVGGGSATTGLPGAVRFSLGGSAASVATTAAPAETQNADEKKVTSLYAVVFKDVTPAAAAVAGSASTEDANDTYFKCIDVLTTGKKLAENNYLFNVCDKKDFGDYQVCFVANPSTGLLGKIQALMPSTSKVSDFKALVEEQAPETKPMLMTSAFMAVKVGAAQADLGKVDMARAMARVDVINTAEGVTVTQIKFVNRAIKTNLYNDAGTAVAEHLESSSGAKTYSVNLVGSKPVSAVAAAATNKCEGQIYTYEQLNTDASAPSLEITYTGTGIAGSKTHTVKFVKGGSQSVTLKRNHLYTVTLTNKGGVVNFNVTVKDWEGNETITVPGTDIANGAQFNNAQVGDFMLKDGTIVKGSVSSLTPEQQKSVIGVVAYIFAEGRAGASLKTKLGREPRGLVLALKNASTGVAWDPNNNSTVDSFNTTLKAAYANSNDGYDITQKAWGKNQPTILKAFETVKDYEKAHPTPSFTTGWYMPSLGEWVDILDSNGLGKQNLSSVKSHTGSYLDTNISGSIVANKLNEALNKVEGSGSTYVDRFTTSDWYWSSSEYSTTRAYHVYFHRGSNLTLYFGNYDKNSSDKVRCVLAF